MQALLLATGETRKLVPLTERIPSPMVTIMNRPVMVYNLELLGRIGFKRILVSVHSLAHVIEKYFGNGQRWGVSLEYILQRDALGSAGALHWARQLLTDDFIVMPADQIADLDIAQAIRQHLSQRATVTSIFRQMSVSPQRQHDKHIRAVKRGPLESAFGIETGIYVFHPSVLECIPPRQPFDIREHLLPALLAKGIQLQSCTLNGYWNPLDTFQNYMEAQNVFLASATRETNESERKESYRYNSVQSRRISEGIWSGKNVRIHRGAKLVPPVSIGSNSWIGRDAELGPSAVIGSSVVVDQGATVRNSIVLDNTYVGKLVHVEDRLVNQDQLVNLYTNEYVQISDSFMLGRTDSDYVMSGFQRPLDFCLALLILLITLPLTLSVAILLTLTTGRPLTRVPCSSPRVSRRNGRLSHTDTFDLLRFNTRKADGRPVPFGAWLERWEGQRLCELLNVIKGDLALVGLKPVVLEEEKRMREAWRLDSAHAGFTGEWYLHTDEHSALEDSLIADTYYLAIPRRLEYWRILVRTPVAWFRKARRRFGE